MNPVQEAAPAALTAALLEQGGTIHLLSCVLTLAALAGLGLSTLAPGTLGPALFLTAALLGALQTFLAIRVGFDAAIFRQVAATPVNWADVDHGLAALNLVAQRDGTRSEDSRRRGALRLLRRQGAAAALQGVLLLTAILVLS